MDQAFKNKSDKVESVRKLGKENKDRAEGRLGIVTAVRTMTGKIRDVVKKKT